MYGYTGSIGFSVVYIKHTYALSKILVNISRRNKIYFVVEIRYTLSRENEKERERERERERG